MQRKITAQYPSNIALVKYWGKYGNQLPCNASLSLTLSKATTDVELTLTEKQEKGIEFDYFFEGNQNEQFTQRVLKYLQAQEEFNALFDEFAIRIDSANSFPHSAGIASSASAFSAIAATFLKASGKYTEENFNQQISHFARLGSGSASRSVDGPFMLWGELSEVPRSSNEFAVPITEIHPHFQDLRDAILIVEDTPKKVSSSVGHSLMNGHPFASARFEQANANCLHLLEILKNGDQEEFVALVEREALTLHAMMMTSNDYYLLMHPNTITIIQKIMEFREKTGLSVCFTLDAGPNIHLIYPSSIEEDINVFIEDNLQNDIKSVIFDAVGKGGTVTE